VTHPSAYVHTASFGSIGLGMGNAIGAAFARPQRPVLLVTGDGGFMHGGLAEFHTAVRYGLDIVVAVMNDRAYTAELVQFVSRSIDPSLSRFDWPSFAAVARAMGGHAETICAAEELRQLPELFQHRAAGPLLLDIRIAGS
jgi:acetolactate synthase I/II/III large subunit